MRRFIILTQYYPPETGAPQNRLHSLAKFMKRGGDDVVVVTAMPSYPKSEVFPDYRNKYSHKEIIDNIPVFRSWIYVTRSREVLSRMLNYFSFVVTSFFKLLRMPKADFIICESPPLFLGITAVLISKWKKSKLVFNVSDLWPESAEKLGIVNNRTLIRMAYRLESWIYRNAFFVSGQTRGIVRNIEARFPGKTTVWFPNGVDHFWLENDYVKRDWRRELGIKAEDFVVLYAGILGHAQGLDVVIRAAHVTKTLPIKFIITGDGPEKESLMLLVKKLGLNNVSFLPNQEKLLIPSLIASCDAYVVPLKKLDLFKGAIPSKLFEPLAMGKPILLGVEGEAKELFIDEGKAGLFFEPENAKALSVCLELLLNDRELCHTLGEQGRSYVRANFDRQEIHRRFLDNFDKHVQH